MVTGYSEHDSIIVRLVSISYPEAEGNGNHIFLIGVYIVGGSGNAGKNIHALHGSAAGRYR